MTLPTMDAEDARWLATVRSRLYPDVIFGNHVSLGRNVSIGPGSIVGHNVVLHDDCQIGSKVRIDDGSVIGKEPLHARLSAVTRMLSLPPTVVGDACLIGTHAVVYRGATIGDGVLIADLATVREQSSIGELSIIGRGVAVENQVSIGRRCKIETGAYITAMSRIGDLCFIAPEVTFTNDNYVGRSEERFKHFAGVTMERGARVGANATVLPGIVIGEDALVAAGSIVTRNVAAGMVAMGVPARAVRPVSPEQLLTPFTATVESCGGL
jgi:UDP-2-acetamido-3-amino-2,3-dideoxy-glucuronate N-acetyltransferase